MADILVVDDERSLCVLLATLLRERGHSVELAANGEAAVTSARGHRPDLVLLDLHMEGIDGLETLRRLRRAAPDLGVVIMTAFGDVGSAVAAMKLGAIDFVSKPFNNEALLNAIDKVLEVLHAGPEGDGSSSLVGDSPALREAVALAKMFAVPDISVLILGETGTGKELFARMMHAASKRRNGPFVAVDCSTLPETLIESELFGHEKGAFTGATNTCVGRFEHAQGGTLFLDEIGNIPPAFQAKLLRVLQERRMERLGGKESIRLDVRVVSATNANLKHAICVGGFRQDLYYRINEVTVALPPLRERDGDIPCLAKHFLAQHARRFGRPARCLSDDALRLLQEHSWPGNVRELSSAMKSAVVRAQNVVLPEHLPPEIRTGTACWATSVGSEPDEEHLRVEIEGGLRSSEIDLKAVGNHAAEQAERSVLAALVSRGHLNGAQMARMLGIDPKTLRVKLRRYGLETPQ